ncbi:MAG: hypothetical protein J6R31_00090 [Rikenellaceae bacterium]|nr:hypothetical protein [Rikenellaceae bacterium]
MERIPIKSSPKLFEAVIQEMQVQMGEGLAWLNHVFGKAEKTVCDHDVLRQYYQKHEHKEAYYTPSVYVGGGKYESIVPDKKDWGDYAFFYMEEPQEVSGGRRVPPYFDLEGTVNVIVWGDSRDIEAQDDRNLESIKKQVLDVLGGMRLTTGRVEWERVYEQDKGVFEEYSMFEEEGQYMMWPYFAFRIKGRVQCNSGCIENV